VVGVQEEEAQKQGKLRYKCRCSFLEIYNEQISDLLEPSSTNLQMREDAKKGVFVEGLLEVEVQSVEDVLHLLLLVPNLEPRARA
jgi:kinesin family protein 15